MKHCLATVLAVIAVIVISSCVCAKNYQIRTAPGTSKFLQDELPQKNTPAVLEAAQNEHEPFQVIIRANKPIKSVSVSAGNLKSGKSAIPAGNIELRLAHYIKLSDSLGGGFRKGYYPDALISMPSTFSVDAGNSQMIWVNVYVPQNALPGVYKGGLTLNIDGVKENIPFSVKVHKFALSEENHFGSAFAFWNQMAAGYYGLTVDSPEYVSTVDRYYWFMTGYRMPPDDLPVAFDSPEAEKYLSDKRVTSFRIPYDPGKPEEFKNRIAYLREKGWLSRGYVYTLDEPAAADYSNCAAYGKAIKALVPDAKWLLTTAPNPVMYGSVDIWCPVLSNYDKAACQDRQAKGEHVWWYTCCGPQHPYPTYLINDTAESARILSWFQAADKVEGVLYWATNIWFKYDGTKYIDRDVWSDPLAFPGANGDGYIIYPGKTYKDDPIPSLRLEMIRQGNEDFETLYLLESAYTRLAGSLGLTKSEYDPHSRVEDYTGKLGAALPRWKPDAKLMDTVRKQLLNDIDTTNAGPKVVVSSSIPEGILTAEKQVAIKVWAEKGTSVTARLIGEKTALLPIRFSAVSGKKYIKSEFNIPLTSDVTQLIVQATKGTSKKTIVRTFKTYSRKPLVLKSSEVICGWNSQADIDKWNLKDVAVELTKDSKIGQCAKLTFKEKVDFPGLRIDYPKGLSECDWSKKGYLAFKVRNPNNSIASFVIKAYDQSGKALDGHLVNLEPGESRIDSWSVQEIGNGIDITKIAGFEFWMWGQPDPVSIYIGPIVITKNKPN